MWNGGRNKGWNDRSQERKVTAMDRAMANKETRSQSRDQYTSRGESPLRESIREYDNRRGGHWESRSDTQEWTSDNDTPLKNSGSNISPRTSNKENENGGDSTGSRPSRAYWFICTYFPSDEETKAYSDNGTFPNIPFDPREWDDCEQVYGQWEMGDRGDKAGRLHLQFVVKFTVQYRYSSVYPRISDNGRRKAWCEPAYSPLRACEYVLKEDSRLKLVWQFHKGALMVPGIKPELGKSAGPKSDAALTVIIDDIKSGLSKIELVQKYPVSYARMHAAIDKVYAAFDKPRADNAKILVEIWFGVSGAGKSHLARTTYPKAYFKKMPGEYWEGYQGQDVVIVEEFVPPLVDGQPTAAPGQGGRELTCAQWNALLDKGEARVNVKFGSAQLKATTFIFTSNINPISWWGDGEAKHAFNRRITRLLEFKHRYNPNLPIQPLPMEYTHIGTANKIMEAVSCEPALEEDSPEPAEQLSIAPVLHGE